MEELNRNLSEYAEREGYSIFQSVGDNHTVYVEKGKTRQVWVDGTYAFEYQYAE